MKEIRVSTLDLSRIWDVMLDLAGGEGCVVAEKLCQCCGPIEGMRIYDELFSEDNLQDLKQVERGGV